MTELLTEARPIRLKGRSFLALVLAPELPFDGWLTRLDDLAGRSPGFFLRRPIVLDVEGLAIGRDALRGLVTELGKRNVRIMGIEGARPSQLDPDMPPGLSDGRPASDFEPPAASERAAPAEGEGQDEAEAENDASEPLIQSALRAMPSIVITQPVRSGQSIIFPEGDVTIVGSVASGAEVVAGGSIHVYGALRGRAMAGTMGNAQARIFCRKLEAELIAIDGFYKSADDIEPDLHGQAVQIWLEGDAIRTGTFG